MDPELKCGGHSLPPKLWTSKKQPGRQFYRCPKPIGEQCDFFYEAIPSPSQNRVLPPTPQSTVPSGSTLYEPPSTPTPLSRKRTSSNDMLSSAWSSQSQKRAKHGDDDDDGNECLMSQAIQPLTFDLPRASACITDEGPSMSQETICSDVSEELSADSVARKLESLNQLPEYIRKLERRKVAAEKSRDMKARKIADLEAEVARLKQREKGLEELIAILESAQE